VRGCSHTRHHYETVGTGSFILLRALRCSRLFLAPSPPPSANLTRARATASASSSRFAPMCGSSASLRARARHRLLRGRTRPRSSHAHPCPMHISMASARRRPCALRFCCASVLQERGALNHWISPSRVPARNVPARNCAVHTRSTCTHASDLRRSRRSLRTCPQGCASSSQSSSIGPSSIRSARLATRRTLLVGVGEGCGGMRHCVSCTRVSCYVPLARTSTRNVGRGIRRCKALRGSVTHSIE
jgi:hypothetical protein